MRFHILVDTTGMTLTGWVTVFTAALAAVLTAAALLIATDGQLPWSLVAIGLLATASLSRLAWTGFLKNLPV